MPTQRQVQEMFGDAEFEADVAASLGPVGRERLDAGRARFIDTTARLAWHGFNVGRNYKPHTVKVDGGPDFLVEPDTVNAAGEHATPYTWGHEFRHDAIKDEMSNRIWDGYRANTQRDWDAAVAMYRDWWIGLYREGVINEVPEDMHGQLRKDLRLNAENFARMEGESADTQRMAKPDSFDSQRDYYKSEAGRRARQFGWDKK